jgi:ABC-2 type transport system ATP-binding protein
MYAIKVSHLAKSFAKTRAVADVSFAVERGEIFGLLGPNGAGKTTTIRMMLGIFQPDQGTVSILGGPMTEAKKALIGYMPEERGLYQDVPLERCLVYLASLKGLSTAEARLRLGPYFDRFELTAHKGKKVKELSKGMQQKAQIINTILHGPELVIIDEPFTALDPINAQAVKELLQELRDQGTTILMSTHQMHQVEELCDRIVLIDEGRNVLYGELDQIRRAYSGHAVLVRTVGDLSLRQAQDALRVPGVERVSAHSNAVKLTLSERAAPQDVLRGLMACDVPLERFEIAMPTLDEIFIRAVADERQGVRAATVGDAKGGA